VFSEIASDEPSATNVPSNSKYFITPFVDDESVVPYLFGGEPVAVTLRFLSPYITFLIAEACKTDKQFQTLNEYKYDYLIQEDIVQYGLTQQQNAAAHSDDWLVSNWEFYRNSKEILTPTDKELFNSTEISVCNSKTYFDSMYLNCSVLELKERVLYISRRHNGALYDCMYVNHTLKKVFAFQSSDQFPNDHK
jgi:hypothetical protein